MWMPGQAVKTRTDALQYAALKMLEQFRPMLDSSAAIKGVTLDLKITPENLVRSVFLSPSFESGPIERPHIERYEFEEKDSFLVKPIV